MPKHQWNVPLKPANSIIKNKRDQEELKKQDS